MDLKMPTRHDDYVTYSRKETILAVTDYYNFLTTLYLKDSQVHYPPAGGWPSIINADPDALAALGKTDEVLALLAHLPYIRRRLGDWWESAEVAPGCYFADWQDSIARLTSGHGFGDAVSTLRIVTEGVDLYQVAPPHVVGLTDGDRENPIIILDTKRGIIHWEYHTCPLSVGHSDSVLYDEDEYEDWDYEYDFDAVSEDDEDEDGEDEDDGEGEDGEAMNCDEDGEDEDNGEGEEGEAMNCDEDGEAMNCDEDGEDEEGEAMNIRHFHHSHSPNPDIDLILHRYSRDQHDRDQLLHHLHHNLHNHNRHRDGPNNCDEDKDEDHDDNDKRDTAARQQELKWRRYAPAWTVDDFFDVLKDHFVKLQWIPTGHHRVMDASDDDDSKESHGMVTELREIYHQHGWPDLARYRKTKCMEAVNKLMKERYPSQVEP
jgi:hypothetical protein